MTIMGLTWPGRVGAMVYVSLDSSESNCVICKVPGSLTVRCQRAGCNKHVHPSCARNDRKAYICTEASMGHHFRSVFCPTHGRDG